MDKRNALVAVAVAVMRAIVEWLIQRQKMLLPVKRRVTPN